MDPLILTGSVRYAHLFSVAIGLGASVLADCLVLSMLSHPVKAALIAMWISGLTMVHIRTRFDPAKFWPKLFRKLAVVAMLTLNAMVIGSLALPLLRWPLGRSPLTCRSDKSWPAPGSGRCLRSVG